MRRVFDLVVGACADNGLIGGTGALVDGSTVHADANRARTIAQRAGFSKLLDRMEKGDVLIVTKLDRLGRDAIDVSTTVAKLEDIGTSSIKIHVEVWTRNLEEEERRKVVDATFVYVAIDEQGRIRDVPR